MKFEDLPNELILGLFDLLSLLRTFYNLNNRLIILNRLFNDFDWALKEQCYFFL